MVSTKTRVMTALAVPAALILSACKADSSVVVKDADNITLSVSFDTELPAVAGLSCDTLLNQSMLQSFSQGAAPVASIKSADSIPGSTVACKAEFELLEVARHKMYSNEGGGHSFAIPSSFWKQLDTSISSANPSVDSPVINISITLPDDIKSVTEGGKVSGNTATWDYRNTPNGAGASTLENYSFRLSEGGDNSSSLSDGEEGDKDDEDKDDASALPSSIPSSKSSDSTKSLTTPTAKAQEKTSDSEDGGLPIAAWIGIALGAIAVIGGVVFAILRSKKKKNAPNAPFGQQPGQFPPAGQQPYPPTQQFSQAPVQPTQQFPQTPDGSAQ